ncbi:cyclic nucleotide-binding domain-containing protein [Haliscomenobacter hydrossis]|uniref:Transcriptional regulator, Crp/Fnr family n=1 Tax=Haliscomenobacter hydrossis (strain ATCC 27775 / DSM 1100 / LMG 10767 / O) TaxID=760192 RepID=F4L1N4_HALH1|nr:cyclic nucleotide-binding domain-containing protein [Haliscomenobacter hydrossis]AEE48578.1 putative transcriptional regulator, Crp/Fnr family [Haliscomenobacter hydrossis DSM 1100]
MKKVLFVLGHLSDKDIEWLIENGSTRQLRSGEYLVRQGESIKEIYIVLSGSLRIFNEQNPQHEIAHISSGEIIGEMSFLDERPPSVSVVANEEVKVYRISLEPVRQYMEVNTRFAARFYYSIALFLSDRLRKTTSRLGYGAPEDDIDELNSNILLQVGHAGSRFHRLLNKFAES